MAGDDYDGRRDRYRDVGAAMRAGLDRINEASDSQKRGNSARQVYLAVVIEVGSWSRLGDHVSRSRLAEQARVSERTVSRMLNYLVDIGAVIWRPGSGRGHWSWVGLVPPDQSGTPEDPRG